MPELPEVETIRKQLNQYTKQKIIRIFKSPFFSKIVVRGRLRLEGLEIESWERYGKYLVTSFSGKDDVMISHLGMSGQWRISSKEVNEKHVHLALKTENADGKIAYFSYIDPRRFGKFYFLTKKGLADFYQGRAPDLLDKAFNQKFFIRQIQRFPKRKVKMTLLDQHLFPGIGNYMASEICAHARVHPERFCESLNQDECEKLFQSVDIVLKGSLKSSGTTFQGAYKDANGEKGEGVKNLVVFYQKKCGLCQRGDVEKIILAGRGTYFCSHCQL